MPEHWCSLLINFMYTKGITFNSGFYFTTIAIYSCWLDTSSNKDLSFQQLTWFKERLRKSSQPYRSRQYHMREN